ncbi:MAG: hypothetical protein ABIY50_01710 [Ignavibacteria bacterium]
MTGNFNPSYSWNINDKELQSTSVPPFVILSEALACSRQEGSETG